jgi:hypothetical protein
MEQPRPGLRGHSDGERFGGRGACRRWRSSSTTSGCGQRGGGVDRHADRPARHRAAGRSDRRAWRASGGRQAGPQGLLAFAGDGARCRFDRRLRRAARRGRRGAARAPRTGALDAGHLPALVHVRVRAPARPGAGRVDWAGLGGRGGARLGAGGGRRRLLHRRGARLRQAGRRFRLYRRARLSPAAGHPFGQRRGAARPPAQGAGPPRDAALRASSKNWSSASVAPALRARSWCAPTRPSGTRR